MCPPTRLAVPSGGAWCIWQAEGVVTKLATYVVEAGVWHPWLALRLVHALGTREGGSARNSWCRQE